MSYFWNNIAKETFLNEIPSENFWSGVKVWIERPHLINPKVLIAEVIETWDDVCSFTQDIEDLVSGDFCMESINKDLKTLEYSTENETKPANSEEDTALRKTKTLVLRNLLPKQVNIFQAVLEAVILDFTTDSATFYPKKTDVLKSPLVPAFPYRFKMFENGIALEVLQHSTEEKSRRTLESEKWLEMKVLAKIMRWCQNIPKHPIVPSLRLVSAKDYNLNLFHLKTKYAKKFVEIWPNYNNTNPVKYVYEDISIAAYLITLWTDERKCLNLTAKQTFVDLGCGNGFLDHILSSEGYKGIGVDLRRRKIWEVYEPETKLIEKVIEPNNDQLYPGYDWIIGNHADELTPWIPVIAARSSYNMRVFLLPCCFYTFDGKYARAHQELTQYQSYMSFLQNLCVAMGFEVQIDKLRIPSTKRTCLVCTSRTYKEEEELEWNIKRHDFINSHLKNSKRSTNEASDSSSSANDQNTHVSDSTASEQHLKNWIPCFSPREQVEVSRNCTNLDAKIIDDIIMKIAKALLATENYIKIQQETDTLLWNRGGALKMSDLGNVLNHETLKGLKSQHGGFKTLLRNHRNIFEVKSDLIQLRVPTINIPPDSNILKKNHKCFRKKDNKQNSKTRNCFFHFHHPQNCPLSACDCSHSH